MRLSFQEACESGRPFRHPGFVKGWYWWFESGTLVAGEYPVSSFGPVNKLGEGDIRAAYTLYETNPLVEFAEDRTEEAAKEFLIHTAKTAPRWFKELAEQLGWPVPKS